MSEYSGALFLCEGCLSTIHHTLRLIAFIAFITHARFFNVYTVNCTAY